MKLRLFVQCNINKGKRFIFDFYLLRPKGSSVVILRGLYLDNGFKTVKINLQER